ncbi:hypothetical protein QEN41_16375 [Gordonia alkanivorans]|nr:hypothetical protein [Gordonia alkanivorans]MDH3021559.1 hypothetical protein [Gordonia alkanivorans]
MTENSDSPDDGIQVITVNVHGRGMHFKGDHLGVMEDQFGLWRVIDVNTGETHYMEKVKNGVRDNPKITIKNFVDHKARREAREN